AAAAAATSTTTAVPRRAPHPRTGRNLRPGRSGNVNPTVKQDLRDPDERGDERRQPCRELVQRPGRVEAADAELRVGLPVADDLVARVPDPGDLVERHGQRPPAVAGEERVEAPELEPACVAWAVPDVPPDRIRPAHVLTLAAPRRLGIRTPAQGCCGKTE